MRCKAFFVYFCYFSGALGIVGAVLVVVGTVEIAVVVETVDHLLVVQLDPHPVALPEEVPAALPQKKQPRKPSTG